MFNKVVTVLNKIWTNHVTRWRPDRCLLCEAPKFFPFCKPCLQELPIVANSCPKCARPLEITATSFCGACLKNPPNYDLTFALFHYEFPVKKLITDLKFHAKLSHAKAFADLFIERLSTKWYLHEPLPNLIIPVPLHRMRLIQRGFNQAIEIAKPIATYFQIPIDRSIRRNKYALPQSSLSATERKINIENSFQTLQRYEGLRVAIVDDVMTTGYTVNALAKKIKEQGATSVHIWCCARCLLSH